MKLFENAKRHSITHHHLLGVLSTEIRRRAWRDRTVRVLDMGCGSGQLIGFLEASLRQILPDATVEIHGFDVDDSKVQKVDYLAGTLGTLSRWHPAIDWKQRITLLRSGDEWPYRDASFDAVISNQVMEHVRDHARAFSSIARVLREDGFSAHLFPLHSSWMEWHLKLPFAHWINNGDVLERYIRFTSRLGLGTWRKYCRIIAPVGLNEFARMNRDFIAFETNYLRERELAKLVKLAGLRYSFRYTGDFYANWLRRAVGHEYEYAFAPTAGLGHRLCMMACKRISSVCLLFEKQNSYENRGFHTPEEFRGAAP